MKRTYTIIFFITNTFIYSACGSDKNASDLSAELNDDNKLEENNNKILKIGNEPKQKTETEYKLEIIENFANNLIDPVLKQLILDSPILAKLSLKDLKKIKKATIGSKQLVEVLELKCDNKLNVDQLIELGYIANSTTFKVFKKHENKLPAIDSKSLELLSSTELFKNDKDLEEFLLSANCTKYNFEKLKSLKNINRKNNKDPKFKKILSSDLFELDDDKFAAICSSKEENILNEIINKNLYNNYNDSKLFSLGSLIDKKTFDKVLSIPDNKDINNNTFGNICNVKSEKNLNKIINDKVYKIFSETKFAPLSRVKDENIFNKISSKIDLNKVDDNGFKNLCENKNEYIVNKIIDDKIYEKPEFIYLATMEDKACFDVMNLNKDIMDHHTDAFKVLCQATNKDILERIINDKIYTRYSSKNLESLIKIKDINILNKILENPQFNDKTDIDKNIVRELSSVENIDNLNLIIAEDPLNIKSKNRYNLEELCRTEKTEVLTEILNKKYMNKTRGSEYLKKLCNSKTLLELDATAAELIITKDLSI